MLEYGLVTTDEEKHSGFLFLIKDSIIDKLRTTTSLSHLNIYIISNKHNIQFYTVIKTQTVRGHNLFLEPGQQQQWEAVPPYQFLESAQTAIPQDPRACSGLPGWN